MLKLTKIMIAGLSLMATQAMADTVLQQNFDSGLGSGERTYSKYWSSSSSSWQYTNNWGVHDGTQNPWTSGGDPYPNPNMSGNVMGHIDGWRQYGNGSTGYNRYERSYYEIDVDLSQSTGSELSFDFDSWIDPDYCSPSDGFNVIAYNGSGGRTSATDTTGFNLLNPTASSDMQYLYLPGNNNGGQLDNISGFDYGYNGHDATMNMAGTAMFSLSAFDGQMITLRFSFGSDQSTYYNPEGINIDNILITDNDTPPPGPPGIPEPTGLSLLGLGLLGFLHRRKLMKA